MRKLFAIAVLVIIGLKISNAQEQGQVVIGGGLLYSNNTFAYSRGEQNEYRTFNFSPSAGVMVNNQITVGLAFNLSHSKGGYYTGLYPEFTEFPGLYYNSEIESNYLTVAPYVRVQKNITDKFNYYLEPYFGKVFGLGGNADSDVSEIVTGIDVGLIYFPTDKFSIEMSIIGLNYSNLSVKNSNYKESDFYINYGLNSPNLGVKFYF